MISLNWTLLVQLAIFLAFVAYLNAFLLRPMGRYLERRKRTIEEHRSTGGEQDAELESLRRAYDQKLDAAHEALLSQRTEARKGAVEIQNSILDEAKKEAQQELALAAGELQKEAAAAREKLADDGRALASLISSKVLGRACQ
jgi:F-type H+-transporting ATPase subunit b